MAKKGKSSAFKAGFALALAMLLLVSFIPMALADNESAGSGNGKGVGAGKGQGGMMNAEKASKSPKFDGWNFYKEMHQQYEIAKGHYRAEAQEFRQAKQNWGNVKSQYKGTGSLGKSTVEAAQSYLLSLNNVSVAQLESRKAAVAADPYLDNETSAARVAELDERISGLNALNGKILAATTKQELASISNEMKDLVKWQKYSMEEYGINRAGYGLGLMIGKAGNVTAKVAEQISLLSAEGKDTSALSEKLSLYEQKITLSDEKRQEAKDKIGELAGMQNATSAERKAIAEEARSLMQQANTYFKEANDILKEIVKRIADLRKQASGQDDQDEENEVEE